VKALNFYSAIYHGILVLRHKKCTIRLGDKSDKYGQGDLVWVTYGNRYQRRRKVFTAVVDSVDTKPLADLSDRDLKAENPEFRSIDEVRELLQRIYDQPVSPEDTVTVIYFSEVAE